MIRTALIIACLFSVAACDKPTETTTAPQTTSTSETTPASASAPATAAQPLPVEPVADPRFAVGDFSEADVPAGLVAEGKVIKGMRFDDANGDNMVVFWTVEASQDIFMAHVLVADGKVSKVLREVKQVRGDCEFDYSAAFVDSAISVTELDGDDKGEVTFAYKYACRSDVSPQDYKLLVLEDGEKSILRGAEILIMQGEEPIGDGKFEVEGFDAAPKLLEHATSIWKRNVTTQL